MYLTKPTHSSSFKRITCPLNFPNLQIQVIFEPFLWKRSAPSNVCDENSEERFNKPQLMTSKFNKTLLCYILWYHRSNIFSFCSAFFLAVLEGSFNVILGKRYKPHHNSRHSLVVFLLVTNMIYTCNVQFIHLRAQYFC